ncbi:MAG TPA: peptidyl-prolyl cis-trans isomerase [Sphingomicrobium sp.]|nr:peptidyl-prolyl cis-trans isomerase [Sphingomicrobium sp.]
MLSSFRRLSKSTIGTSIIAGVGLLILIGFAMGDIQSLSLGNGGMSSDTLAKAGSLQVSDRDMSSLMQQRLAQVRQQNPEAGYAQLAGDFEPLLDSLIGQRALQAFAKDNGFVLSKRLVDAQIANIPGVKGLNGQFSDAAYQSFLARQHMTDADIRDVISGSMLQRLLITPAVTNARVPVGVATPYASMLLEERQGAVALIPVEAFAAGLNPNDAQLQQYYAANKSRYMIPEQRVLKIAKIGPEQVSNVSANPQEIQSYYNAHQDVYGSKDIRTIDQAVVPDQKVAAAIAERARSGQSFVDAAKPAGLTAADVQAGPQSREGFTELAGDKAAAAAFGAKQGEVVGPIQTDLGWHVIKIESIETKAGKSLAAAHDEIATAILTQKQQDGLADLVDKVQDSIDGGSNFDEAVKSANLQVTTTPLITAGGVQRDNPSYKFPQELAPALKTGFEIAPTDEPVIEQLADNKGFALVAPAQVVPTAPAPIASIHDQVKSDWIHQQALDRAKAAANQIAAKAKGSGSLEDAVKAAGKPLPPVRTMRARRIQLSQLGDKVPAPLRALFSGTAGKTQVGGDPQGRGFFVVKVDKIIPGNALTQPGLITEVQGEFSEPLSQEYAQQFLTAVKQSVGVKRNDSAIVAAKKRITGGGE